MYKIYIFIPQRSNCGIELSDHQHQDSKKKCDIFNFELILETESDARTFKHNREHMHKIFLFGVISGGNEA